MKKLLVFIMTLVLAMTLYTPICFARDYEILHFSGDEETYTTLTAGDSSNQSVGSERIVTRITSNDHGFKAGSYVWISGTDNFDGLRKIAAVATNTIDIYAKYVAETFAGTETVKAAAYFNEPWELLGFRIHLSEASATSENLVVAIDSNNGTAYDVKLYTKDMNTLQDVRYRWSPAEPLGAKDAVTFTWVNTNDKTWGIDVIYRLVP